MLDQILDGHEWEPCPGRVLWAQAGLRGCPTPDSVQSTTIECGLMELQGPGAVGGKEMSPVLFIKEDGA